MGDPDVARARFLQWVVIAAWIAMFTTILILDLPEPPRKRTPAGCVAAFLTALAHGLWITLDARALNRPVGAWRFAAYFLGPLALWAWFGARYRLKSLYLIPVSIAVYLIPIAQVSVALMVGLIPETR